MNNTGTVRLSGAGGNQINNEAEVSLNDGGTLDLAGMSEAIDGLLGHGGRITNSGSQASTLEIGTDGNYHTPNATAFFSGTIEDGNSPVSLIFHRGTQILEGIYSHTGPTTVRSSLIVNGTISHSPISVQAGALSGVGQLNSVLFVSGILSPGASPRSENPGTISIDTLSFAGSPTVQLDVGSSAPGGSPSDLILVQGNLSFHNQTKFEFNLSDGYLAPGDYPLIRYSGVLAGTNAEVKIVSDGFAAGIPERTRQTFTLDAVGTPGAVLLRVVGNSASLRWQGDGNSETLSDLWNFEDTNWWESERFHNLDSVTFDDTGAVTSPRITIDGPITFGSKLIVNNNTGHDYWFSGGSLRGNGRLIKSGSGTLHINGTSAEHTGGTLISQGTILFGGYRLGTAAITLGDSETGSRDVALLLTGKLNPVTISSAIRVSEEGTGDVTLGAVSTTSTGSYQFRGPLILDRPTTLTHSGTGGGVDYFGPISGNVDTLTVTGGNTTVLLAVNTFLGDIVITGDGTILSSGGNSIPAGTNVDIGLGARLEPYKAVVNVLTGSGSVRALTIGFGNGSGTFDGEVIGAGTLTKVGTGTQTLAGDSPFTGTLQIDEGKLIVNGKMSGSRVEVTDAGTLAGNGSVGHVTLQTGGRLAPGDGLGTLSANSLKWYGGAWLAFELAAGDSSDLLSLGSGSFVKEEGSTFAFDFGGTGAANTAYVLATFSSTSFQVSDFSYRNLAPGLDGSFLLTSSTLSFTTVPEPSGFALLIVASSLLGACRFPRWVR